MKRGASTYGSRVVAAALAGVVLAGGTGLFPTPFPTPFSERADAAEVVYAPSPNGLESASSQTEIEALANAYDRARAVAISCDVRVAANQKRVAVLEAKIPVQQKRSDDAMRELYKMQRNRHGIVEMLLASRSLDEFIRQSEYMDRINRANLNAINELKETRERLAAARANLDAAKAESDAVLDVASKALDSARAARTAKQQSGSAGSGVSFDGADWYMTEAEFVDAWAPRIDAYLAGSPLSGQGATFARASWKYCVDPRWSPAISNTESSKGAYCIRPHNAWGWGAADSDPYNLAAEWGTWEEAIDAHVRGLAEGYGYTISLGAAKAYCPPTSEEWYNNTRGQMEMI